MIDNFIHLSPVFKQMIWGGNRLRTDFGYQIPGDNTGECWAISAHPNGDCIVKGGSYDGSFLSELWHKHRELFGNYDCDRFPLLVKIIDAKEDLSIQVHPNDAYASEHENGSLGKMECWYILDCKEDSKLVVGHNAKDKTELKAMIEQNRWKEFIREIPIKKGDFIQIDPGTVHAIKGGIVILETQQNSDITYRVYDYNRLSNGKPRELHVSKSIDVITAPAKSPEHSIQQTDKVVRNVLHKLIECEYYQVYLLKSENEFSFEMNASFLLLSVTEGEGEINGVLMKKGEHVIAPYGCKHFSIKGRLDIILSTPN